MGSRFVRDLVLAFVIFGDIPARRLFPLNSSKHFILRLHRHTDDRSHIAKLELFYFAVRYGLPIDADEERVLRRWHELDPVDSDEMVRNNRIESIQGNRNVFIDHPEYVVQIEDF